MPIILLTHPIHGTRRTEVFIWFQEMLTISCDLETGWPRHKIVWLKEAKTSDWAITAP